MSPAPNSTRNNTHRSSHIRITGGAMSSFPRKTARNPASRSSDSQPKPYQVWPTLTMDRYSAHSTAQHSIAAPSGRASAAPATTAPASAAPDHAHSANSRSE
ncbi:hypothetical protein SXANM310S_04139 [Streptomyces xanthochromogenes]